MRLSSSNLIERVSAALAVCKQTIYNQPSFTCCYLHSSIYTFIISNILKLISKY